MPLVTRIRHLGAFALVEANNRLFIDGQAHTPNNLAPIAFDKLGAISAISTQRQEFLGDPLFSLPRAIYIQPNKLTSSTIANNVFFDSTINLCGKNIGSPGVRYDSASKRYYVANKKNQYQADTAWALKIYDQNFDLLYSSDMPSSGNGAAGQSGIFLNPKTDVVQFMVTQQLSVDGVAGGSSGTSRLIKFNSSVSTAPVSVADCSGWMQVVHQDSNNVGNWMLAVESSLAGGTVPANFNRCYAVDRLSGSAFSLGTTSPKTGPVLNLDTLDVNGNVTKEGTAYFVYADAFGCLASNAEYLDQSGSGSDPVFFYTMRTNSSYSTAGNAHDRTLRKAYQITVCKVSDLQTAAPAMAVSPCTYSPVDFELVSDLSSATRRFRPFVFRDTTSGLDFLGIVVYEPAANTTAPLSQTAQNIYVFRIGGAEKNELTFLQKVPIGEIGVVRGAMPMDSSMKKWLICYSDRFCIYQWNPTSGFTLQSTQNVKPQWVGVDSLGRIWVAESETLSLIFGDGQKLYYYPSSGTAIALQASFQASSYTFSGTPINSNIVINAYDLSGARTAVDVIVNLEGSNVSFSDGSTQKQLTTSSTGNTLVPITVKSTGLLRATIMEAV